MQYELKSITKYSSCLSYGSTYDYHFIIKELAKEFDRQFECLGENTDIQKYITFSVSVNKEITKTDKDSNDNTEVILYKLKFIESVIFTSTSLSSRVIIFLMDYIAINVHNANLVLPILKLKIIN